MLANDTLIVIIVCRTSTHSQTTKEHVNQSHNPDIWVAFDTGQLFSQSYCYRVWSDQLLA